MKVLKLLAVIAILLPVSSVAQEIAIIDQGLNANFTNNGLFYNPLCVGRRDEWTRKDDPNESYPALVNTDANDVLLPDAYVGVYRMSLCRSGSVGVNLNGSVSVPRFRGLPSVGVDNFGQEFDYQEFALLFTPTSYAKLYTAFKIFLLEEG